MKKVLSISLLGFSVAIANGQAVITDFAATPYSGGVSTGGYTQDFSSLPSTGTQLTGLAPAGGSAINNHSGTFNFNGLTLDEWSYAAGTLSSATAKNLFGGTSSGSGAFYNAPGGNLATSTDRSLGSLSTGSASSLHLGLQVKNSTGTSTGMAVLGFTLEQFRIGTHAAGADGFDLSFAIYKSGATYSPADLLDNTKWKPAVLLQSTTDGTTFTTVSGSRAAVPNQAGTAATVNSSLPANQLSYRASFAMAAFNTTWDDGDVIAFRFSDVAASGSNSGFAVDNLQVVPEPATMAVIGVGLAGLVSRRQRK